MNANEVYYRLIALKRDEHYGFVGAVGNAAVTHRGNYMELDSKEGVKKTNCSDAAQYMTGKRSFDEVREQ